MKSASRYSILVLAVSSALVGNFFLGQHYGNERVVEIRQDGSDPYIAGQVLARGTSAWLNAANLHSYLAFFDSDRLDELPNRIESNLWYLIPDLYQFTTNPNANNQERDSAKRVLKRIVLYFYKHPREHIQPQEVDLSEEVTKAAEMSPLSSDPDSTEQKVFSELAEGVGRALSGFDEAIEQVLVKASDMDREIQEILDQLVEQREFPGREKPWGRRTIHLPRIPGVSGGGSDDKSFDYQGDGFDLIVTSKGITLNGKDYGEVPEGGSIDFRVPEKIFVDGEERFPRAK